MNVDVVPAAGGFVVSDEPWLSTVLVTEGTPPRWRLPKGLVEPGESLEAAALREVHEETGLTCDIVEEIGSTEWEYEYRGMPLQKHVTFFLMRVRERSVALQRDEVVRGRALVSLELAPALLAFESERQIARRAIQRLGYQDVPSSP